MSNFFSSIADKAQSALNNSPLAQHIPSGRGGRTDNDQSQQSEHGAFGSRTLGSIQHQLRTFQQQYSSSTTPVQKIITTQKGVAIDFDNVSRDAHAHSKEFYLWGQSEPDDLKDVTDRLAWLNFLQGSLANTLATKINTSRTSFKALRAAEANLAPRQNIRTSLQNQINKIENDNQRGQKQKIAELKAQLQKAEVDDHELEKEVELLKRKAVRESEQAKWEAFREYGEKLALLSQAALAVVPVLPPVPPSDSRPYTGAEETASVRASLQKALDSYTPGALDLVLRKPSASDLKRSDTRSFGETHAQELSLISSRDPSVHPSIPVTPPASTTDTFAPPAGPPPAQSQPNVQASTQSGLASSPPADSQTPPLNPAMLNQTPAPIPLSPENANKASPVVAPDPADPSAKVPSASPTVAETGVPKSAGPGGPGPASGSLLNIKSERKSAQSTPISHETSGLPGYGAGTAAAISHHETAEEEKQRLQREERERLLREGGSAQAGPPPTETKHESAEEEKKHLEREERDRVLREGGHSGAGGPPDSGGQHPPPDDGDLPPYQEM